MSRSATYRTFRLTAADRAAFEAEVRERRRRQQQRRAAERMRSRDDSASDAGRAGVRRDGQVGRETGLGRSDRVAAGRDVLPDHRPATVRPASVRATAGPSPTDIAAVEAELDSVVSTAGELGLPVEGEAAARARLRDAAAETDAGGRARHLAAVQALVRSLDTRVMDALEAAECRARTVDAVVRTLQALGFTAFAPGESEEETVIDGRAGDGRLARIVVAGREPGIEVTADFTDPGTSVPAGHPHAEQVCEAAALDAAEFHEALVEVTGLEAGALRASGRPTRAVGPSASARAAVHNMRRTEPIRRTVP